MGLMIPQEQVRIVAGFGAERSEQGLFEVQVGQR